MSTKHPRIIIHLEWEGPFTWKEKDKLIGRTDYGLYQVYGCHPVYGNDTLLYIGKASEQTFAKRLKQEAGNWPWNQDFQRLAVYVGRPEGASIPSAAVQREQIDLAEKLLIRAHEPAHNCQKGIDFDDARLREVHLLNWGCFRSLLPEASGWRHSSKFWLDMHVFKR